MGVLDGQPVSAAVTNPAFLDANADDTALGKLSLNNISDIPTSGPAVNNIQREFNAISSFTGKATNLPIGTTPPWTNNDLGSPTDNLFVRTDTITQRFDGTLGHAHTGADGDGPQLSGSAITNVPYIGYFAQGIILSAVTGGSTDVSIELTGKTPSNGQTILGVVVNTPYNKTILRQGSGPNTGDEFLDGSGNVVYGRVTEAVGVWTLTYYVDIAGTETPYSFGSAVDIDWYYQELFDPMVATPVYSQIAFTPSDNTTADVVDATETVAGKVLLGNVAPPAIAATGAKGTSTRVAHEDHTHEGVHAVLVDGDPTQGLGNVTIKAGAGISIVWNAGQIEITATGVNTPRVEYRTITSGEALAKSLTLAFTPNLATNVMLDTIGGTAQIYGTDYTVSTNVLSWSGLGLDGFLDTGDNVRILYWT